MIKGSFFVLERWGSEVLLIILIIQLSGDVIEGDWSFVVNPALHLLHGFFSLSP